jgi:hypothetical protein
MNLNKPSRMLLILMALLVAIPIGWVGEIQAQTGPQGSPGAPGAGSMMQKQVQGKIASMDPSGKKLTLEDGTQLTIPPNVNVQRGALQEGAIVKASFEERDGQKIVTSLEVQSP